MSGRTCNKYKGIIFDLDGVICSTDEYHYEAWKAIGEKIGIHHFTREDNNRQRGVSRMESLEILLEKSDQSFTEEEKQRLAEEKNQLYRELLKNLNTVDLPEEVKLTLHTLKKMGIRLAVGSSSKNTGMILDRLGLGTFFDAVIDGNCIRESKPAPEVFLKAAEAIGLSPSECLVVEDAVSGIEAGCAGGFDTVGIGEAMTCPRTTYPISEFTQILNLMS